MQAPRTNIGAIARAGRASGQAVLSGFETARKYSPDYTGLAIEGMKARSAEKQAAMAANAKVASAKMSAKATMKKTELDIEVAEAQQDAKKAKAKGGIIAKAGGLISMGLIDDGPEKPADYSMLNKLYNKQEASINKAQTRLDRGTRMAGEVAAAGGAASNVQPAANQQTAQPVASSNTKTAASSKDEILSKAKPASGLIGSMGFSDKDFSVYKKAVSGIESGGVYDIAGGSGGHYDGKYQLGAAAKTDAARVLGINDPGHSSGARANFRNSPQLQEQMFEGYTKANHNFLMSNPNYANADPRRRLEILGYAHNQGMGAASDWLNTGKVGRDGFGTAGTMYPEAIRAGFGGL